MCKSWWYRRSSCHSGRVRLRSVSSRVDDHRRGRLLTVRTDACTDVSTSRKSGGAADWFDISLVDGFSVPADIANDVNCAKPSCTANINAACPEERA